MPVETLGSATKTKIASTSIELSHPKVTCLRPGCMQLRRKRSPVIRKSTGEIKYSSGLFFIAIFTGHVN
ncbi:hypothetical protein ACTXT7_003618 [Hymenolepis weldensis]